MAGQSAMLTRKEATAKQNAVCYHPATPSGGGNSGNVECHPATPGTKKNPTSAKG